MAAQPESAAALPAPEIVGNAFIAQYYTILLQTPDQVHKFYQDSSSLSRPGPNGVMTTVTTMQGINDQILSFDYNNYQVEILTADSQISYQNGVIVFVTGFLIGKDQSKRKFTQSFFLAPQNVGFFVLNDILRYVDDDGTTVIATYDHEPKIVVENDVNEEVQAASLVPEAENAQVIDYSVGNHTSELLEENINNNNNNSDKSNHHLENGEIPSAEKEIKVTDPWRNSTQNDVPPIAEKTSPVVKQDAEKKSYASLVNALKENPAPFQVKVSPKPSVPLRPAPPPEVPAPSSNSSLERNIDRSVTAKGHSIFIRNLPCDATAEQLETVFKKFGSIKRDGIQVRGFKDQQSCFGFVEFDSLSSVESAIQASPIAVGNRNATVEMKRRDNNEGGRFRGGFRNDSFRPRGNFGGRGYSRNDFEKQGEFSGRENEKRGEFSGRARGSNGRNGGGNNGRNSSNNNGNAYPREKGVYQNGTASQTVEA